MKKVYMILFSLVSPAMLSAQTTGKMNYEEKVKLEIKLDGADQAMLDNFPKERTTRKELYFTPDASLYKNKKTEASTTNVEAESGNGPRMIIKMDEADDRIFSDLKNSKRVEKRDFMSRTFLIESDLNSFQWKMTGNQKMILNFPCEEAVLQDTSKKVTVWFTPAIPVSTGPGGYANLPGLILALDMDNGKRTVTAIGLDTNEFDHAIIAKPTEGKKMTKEAFNKMMEEKRKEMMEEYGGKGDVIIKVKH